MKSIIFAYHDIGCAAIRTLHEMREEICAVFTHEDDPKENLWFGSVMQTAEKLGIPVFTPENANSAEWIEKIRALRPDIILSFYYRKLICDDILNLPPKGALNLHGSLLPKYRGRAPVNWVIVNGEKETGITLHYMVKQADAGDIVAQKKVTIAEDDTALTLFRKLVPLTEELIRETVPQLASGKAPKIPQDHSQATVFRGRKPEDGKIDWTKPSEEIYNLVRAVTHPYPGAFTFWDGKKIFIWQSRKSKTEGNAKPGTITGLNPLMVICGKETIELTQIQTENGMEMNGSDWTKENHLKTGSVLGEN